MAQKWIELADEQGGPAKVEAELADEAPSKLEAELAKFNRKQMFGPEQ